MSTCQATQNTVTDLPEPTGIKSDEDDDVDDIIRRMVQITDSNKLTVVKENLSSTL